MSSLLLVLLSSSSSMVLLCLSVRLDGAVEYGVGCTVNPTATTSGMAMLARLVPLRSLGRKVRKAALRSDRLEVIYVYAQNTIIVIKSTNGDSTGDFSVNYVGGKLAGG